MSESDNNKPVDAKPEEAVAEAAPAAAGPEKSKLPMTYMQISEQMDVLKQQKEELTITLNLLKEQITKIQTSLRENENLKVRTLQQMSESYTNFLEEWSRKSEFYPEIRYQILLKTTESITPKKR